MVNINNKNEQIIKTQDTGTYSGTYGDIKREFDQLNPAPINVACTSWARLASQIGDVANSLLGTAGAPLHQAWESKTSPDAQQQLQIAQATAAALADQCMQMARATDWAFQYAQWYKEHVPGDGLITTGGDADRINEHRVALLSRYNEVIGNVIPSAVRASYVQTKGPNQGDFTATPGPGPAGPGPSGPGPGPFGPGPGFDPTGPGPGFDGAAPGIDTSSSLAGFDGGASGPGAGAFGGGPGAGGLGAGSLGAGGGGLGAGSLGAGGGLGAGGSGLAGGGAGAGGGGLTGVGGAGVGGGAGGAGRGVGMMPMTGGGGQGGQQDRERTTWLAEDESVWGETDAPPGVIDG
jgi:hypothetical protein